MIERVASGSFGVKDTNILGGPLKSELTYSIFLPQCRFPLQEIMSASVKLSADETKARFGVAIAIENFPSDITPSEAKNVQTVLNYMEVCSYYSLLKDIDLYSTSQIAYSPVNNKGTESVKHLLDPNDTFEAVSTFPKAHSAGGYADEHAKVMSALSDLRIVRFDIVSPKGKL